jgi:hypothetical protein
LAQGPANREGLICELARAGLGARVAAAVSDQRGLMIETAGQAAQAGQVAQAGQLGLGFGHWFLSFRMTFRWNYA